MQNFIPLLPEQELAIRRIINEAATGDLARFADPRNLSKYSIRDADALLRSLLMQTSGNWTKDQTWFLSKEDRVIGIVGTSFVNPLAVSKWSDSLTIIEFRYLYPHLLLRYLREGKMVANHDGLVPLLDFLVKECLNPHDFGNQPARMLTRWITNSVYGYLHFHCKWEGATESKPATLVGSGKRDLVGWRPCLFLTHYDGNLANEWRQEIGEVINRIGNNLMAFDTDCFYLHRIGEVREEVNAIIAAVGMPVVRRHGYQGMFLRPKSYILQDEAGVCIRKGCSPYNPRASRQPVFGGDDLHKTGV